MEQENKELLLKDLSARLPYGVIVELDEKFGFNKGTHTLVKELLDLYCVEGIKPYLRTISSMTEEEFVYFMSIRGMNLRSYEIREMMSKTFSHPNNIAIVNTLGSYSNKIDWLNKNMFDWRGLIPMNLALEAPEGMYNINK